MQEAQYRAGGLPLPSSGRGLLFGLWPFTPHDLRRTAAILAGDLGFDDAWIAKCLDHAASKKQEQIVPSVRQPSCGGSLASLRQRHGLKRNCVLVPDLKRPHKRKPGPDRSGPFRRFVLVHWEFITDW